MGFFDDLKEFIDITGSAVEDLAGEAINQLTGNLDNPELAIDNAKVCIVSALEMRTFFNERKATRKKSR